MKTRLVVVDTETGGLDPQRNALLSVAAVDSRTGDVWEGLIKPAEGLTVESDAMAINGLDLEEVRKNGMEERDAMMSLWCWARLRKDAIFAGCSPEFDANFLRAAFARAKVGWPFTHRTLDLRAAAWCAYEAGIIELPVRNGGGPRFDLDAILGALGLARNGKCHDAVEDAELEMEAFKAFTQILKKEWGAE